MAALDLQAQQALGDRQAPRDLEDLQGQQGQVVLLARAEAKDHGDQVVN